MITLELSGTVATVTLERPPVNAINDAWIRCLDGILERIESSGEIAVIHLRSSLGVFCAGADLAMMKELLQDAAGRDRMIESIREIQQVYARLQKSPAVSIAELGGAAMGGGLELALACDLRVAATGARLGLPEVKLGLLPAAGGTQRLTRICGRATALRLILTGEAVAGSEALELGLVHRVEPAAELAGRVRELVTEIAALPGAALAACKRCINAAGDSAVDGFAMELAETRELHDLPATRKLIEAFLQRV